MDSDGVVMKKKTAIEIEKCLDDISFDGCSRSYVRAGL